MMRENDYTKYFGYMIDLFMVFLTMIVAIIIIGLFYGGMFLLLYFILGFFIHGTAQLVFSLVIFFIILIVSKV